MSVTIVLTVNVKDVVHALSASPAFPVEIDYAYLDIDKMVFMDLDGTPLGDTIDIEYHRNKK